MGCVIKYKGQSIPEEQFLQYLNKQIAINNLFNENETLANAVYEALGFSQNNVEAQKRIDLAYKQLDETRKYVSFEMLNDPEDAEPGDIIYIDDISTEKTQRKKGYATSTYIYIGEQLLKQGLRFQSTSKLTAENTIWENLYKLGLATKKESNASTIGYVYEYIGLQNQITPQQKQQAQQAYSQYLDTIFPNSKVKDIVYHGTSKDFDKFNKEPIWSLFEQLDSQVASKEGIFFGKSQKHVKPFGNKIVFALLNIKNPLNWGKDINDNARELNKLIGNQDAIYSVDTVAGENYPEVVVFEPEQIHILSSKADIEGFKQFVGRFTQKVVDSGIDTSKKIEVVNRYTNTDVKANPDKIYVFGDNTDRKGTGGQAAIRNNSNAFGIATKIHPTNNSDAFMSDKDLESNKKVIDSDIQKILDQNKPLVFPKDGFGTGLAKLKEKAPKTYQYLKEQLLDKFGFNNDTGEIVEQPINKEIKDYSVLEIHLSTGNNLDLTIRVKNNKTGEKGSFSIDNSGRWVIAKFNNKTNDYEIVAQPLTQTQIIGNAKLALGEDIVNQIINIKKETDKVEDYKGGEKFDKFLELTKKIKNNLTQEQPIVKENKTNLPGLNNLPKPQCD